MVGFECWSLGVRERERKSVSGVAGHFIEFPTVACTPISLQILYVPLALMHVYMHEPTHTHIHTYTHACS